MHLLLHINTYAYLTFLYKMPQNIINTDFTLIWGVTLRWHWIGDIGENKCLKSRLTPGCCDKEEEGGEEKKKLLEFKRC